jgi:hypothetical protein
MSRAIGFRSRSSQQRFESGRLAEDRSKSPGEAVGADDEVIDASQVRVVKLQAAVLS